MLSSSSDSGDDEAIAGTNSSSSHAHARRSRVHTAALAAALADLDLVAASASDARKLSALEGLPAEVLDLVLQQLGPAEASRVRVISRTMRDAADRVAGYFEWPTLRLVARSAKQLYLAAEIILRRRLFRKLQLQLSANCEIDLVVAMAIAHDSQPLKPTRATDSKGRVLEAVERLFSACSASSGGIRSISIKATAECPYVDTARGIQHLIAAALRPLAASKKVAADGGSGAGSSCSHLLRLKSLEVTVGLTDIDPHDRAGVSTMASLIDLLADFRGLERLVLPFVIDTANKAVALSAALPALRSTVLRLSDSVGLAAFARHRAIEELEIDSQFKHVRMTGFAAFVSGSADGFVGVDVPPAAAHRLRKLAITFGGSRGSYGFDESELCSLGRLTSLEALELTVVSTPEELKSRAAGFGVALASLGKKLRDLSLCLLLRATPPLLLGLAGALMTLRARSSSLVTLRLDVEVADNPEKDAMLEKLIRAAGPCLVELKVRSAFMHRRVFFALRDCPRLRALYLNDADASSISRPLPLATVVDSLVPCRRLEALACLYVPFDDEREATEGLEPLARLAEACSRLGDGRRCVFILRPGARLQPGAGLSEPDRLRVTTLAKRGIQAVFPRAMVVGWC